MAEHPAGHLVLKWLVEQDAKMKEAEREGKYKMSNPWHAQRQRLPAWGWKAWWEFWECFTISFSILRSHFLYVNLLIKTNWAVFQCDQMFYWPVLPYFIPQSDFPGFFWRRWGWRTSRHGLQSTVVPLFFVGKFMTSTNLKITKYILCYALW